MAQEKTGNGGDGFTEVTSDEWVEVSDESQIVFDTIGDEWIGQFLSMEQIGAKGMWQGHFQGTGENAAESYFCNLPFDLKKKLEKVPAKALVKIRYDSDLPTGKEKPMMVFKVWHK